MLSQQETKKEWVHWAVISTDKSERMLCCLEVSQPIRDVTNLFNHSHTSDSRPTSTDTEKASVNSKRCIRCFASFFLDEVAKFNLLHLVFNKIEISTYRRLFFCVLNRHLFILYLCCNIFYFFIYISVLYFWLWKLTTLLILFEYCTFSFLKGQFQKKVIRKISNLSMSFFLFFFI